MHTKAVAFYCHNRQWSDCASNFPALEIWYLFAPPQCWSIYLQRRQFPGEKEKAEQIRGCLKKLQDYSADIFVRLNESQIFMY